MSNRAAIRYAKAILSLAQEQNSADKIYKDMQLVAQTINDSEELQSVLVSSIIKSDVKKSALLAIFEGKVDATFINLFDLLITNKRLADLADVATQYISLFDELSGTQVAQVTTAVALTSALEKKVLAKVKELTGKEAIIESIVNPDIVGGFILRVGDVQYDASIANKLSDLKRQFNA